MQSPAPSTDTGTMALSTVDLFILTFNCAKNLISPSVFAAHLYGALTQNATGLPDLVVLSLQEVAPLSYAFIGSYFLNPYYARFGEALNLASARVLLASAGAAADDDGPQGKPPPPPPPPPYTLVRAKNVGMTAILLYARDPARVRKIEEAECGFGAADMGNKGAVGLRVTWSGHQQTTELTFVAAHLAAMEWNLKKRNSNWRSIVAGLTFANPRAVIPPGEFPANRDLAPTPDRSGAEDIVPPVPSRLPTGDSPDPSEEEPEPEPEDSESSSDSSQPLLAPLQHHHNHHHHRRRQPDEHNTGTAPPFSPSALASLHAISVYKPTAYLFVAGDLNYRIGATAPPPRARFPSLDPSSEDYFPSFLPRDQLTRERRAGRTLHGLREAPVAFGPTYKFDVLPASQSTTSSSSSSSSSPSSSSFSRERRRVSSPGEGGGGEEGEEGVGLLVQQPEGLALEVEEVPWRFAPHRWPGWTDRVLYLDVPPWVSRAGDNPDEEAVVEDRADIQGKTQQQQLDQQQQEQEQRGEAKAADRVRVQVRAYDALPVVATSDHRAVFFRATVPVLGPDEMRPPEGGTLGQELRALARNPPGKKQRHPQTQQLQQQQQQQQQQDGHEDRSPDPDPDDEGDEEIDEAQEETWKRLLAADPRVRLPVPVDVHAWERRAAARRKEVLLGWTALLWSTREGALALGTALALGVGGWWLWRVW